MKTNTSTNKKRKATKSKKNRTAQSKTSTKQPVQPLRPAKKGLTKNQMIFGGFGVALLIAMLFTMLPQQTFTSGGNLQAQDHGDYLQFSEFASEQPEVAIYFSYACPHCFNAHASLIEATERMPGNTQVHWVQVPFFPRENSIATRMMQAAAIAEHLDQQHALNQALFEAYHLDSRIRSAGDVNSVVDQWLAQQQYSERFAELIEQPDVQAKVEQMRQRTEQSPVQAVPAITVNGQYQLKLQSVASGDDLRNLIGRLLRR